SAFTHEALASYLPTMDTLVNSMLGGWATGEELRWLEGLKRLAIESICLTVLGLPAGPVVDAVARDYELLGGGFSSLPIPLPGTKFTRAKQALGRIFAVYEQNIREHQAAPKADGLSRILAARSIRDGRAISV